MNENQKTVIWMFVLVLLILNLTTLCLYYQPKWNKTTDCLRETARKICNDNNLAFSHSDGYPNYNYEFWCERDSQWEFTEQEVERCK